MSEEKTRNLPEENVRKDGAELATEDLEKVSGGAFDAYMNFNSSSTNKNGANEIGSFSSGASNPTKIP